jgi:hypothetical protein
MLFDPDFCCPLATDYRPRTLQLRLNSPRFPQGLAAEAIGLVVANEFILGNVVLHLPIQVDRYVRGVADDVGVAGRIRVSFG